MNLKASLKRRTGTERAGAEQIVRDGDAAISRAAATASPAADSSGRDDVRLSFVGLRNVLGRESERIRILMFRFGEMGV